jgi:hypothetical protein
VIELLNGRRIRLHAVTLTAGKHCARLPQLAEGTWYAHRGASETRGAVLYVESRLTMTSGMEAWARYLAAAEAAGATTRRARPGDGDAGRGDAGIAAYLKRRG